MGDKRILDSDFAKARSQTCYPLSRKYILQLIWNKNI